MNEDTAREAILEARALDNEVAFETLIEDLTTSQYPDERFPTERLIVVIKNDELEGPSVYRRFSISEDREGFFFKLPSLAKERDESDKLYTFHLVYVWTDIRGYKTFIPRDQIDFDSSEAIAYADLLAC